MSRFSVHGTVTLDVEDRILLVEGTGPWNKESVVESDKTVAPLIDRLAGKPWAALVVLYGKPVYLPEATSILSQSIRVQKQLGRVATAVIVMESKSPEFVKSHLSQIYHDAGECVRFFTERQQAHWWLIQQISQQQQVESQACSKLAT